MSQLTFYTPRKQQGLASNILLDHTSVAKAINHVQRSVTYQNAKTRSKLYIILTHSKLNYNYD